MAMKPWCYFTLGYRGDGSTTQQVFNLLSDPFALAPAASPAEGTNIQFSFSLSLSILPTAIEVIGSSDGQTVTPTLGSLGNITFAWPDPPSSNENHTLLGRLFF